MKYILSFVLLVCSATVALADCGSTWVDAPPTFGPTGIQFYCTVPSSATLTTTSKSVVTTIFWSDGFTMPQVVTDSGQNRATEHSIPLIATCTRCYPEFYPAYFQDTGNVTEWHQLTRNVISLAEGVCSLDLGRLPIDHHIGHSCRTPGQCLGTADYFNYPTTGCITGLFFSGPCTRSNAFRQRCADPSGYEPDSCSCPDGMSMSPIIIDVDHSGFSLTDENRGVAFNILNDGVPLAISWIAPESTNAFLVLDRNGNGTIDGGAELFGDLTPQPQVTAPNGFLALAVYDSNGDGLIDRNDKIYSALRLWQDTNHNGISEKGELHPLDGVLKALDLHYEKSTRVDQYGNQFRYRAKVYDMNGNQGEWVNGVRAERWAWDVFVKFQ